MLAFLAQKGNSIIVDKEAARKGSASTGVDSFAAPHVEDKLSSVEAAPRVFDLDQVNKALDTLLNNCPTHVRTPLKSSLPSYESIPCRENFNAKQQYGY
ncbi:hypothetical protein PCASD_04957 [Puccinia coronata f. sp. avenae]|uniref:Uncharacterized protein n=1 Tax=Puccinia coronata f. sp. avenae TaxID=200324 RepID=A0A2N5VD70_9BASI|nr:hypothetical protein PCASD_04957 [Puccinia coronata f. sp. avenae]